MQININDEAITQKLERIAKRDGLSAEEVVTQIIRAVIADDRGVDELEAYLQPRIERAQRGEAVETTVGEIFADVRKELAL